MTARAFSKTRLDRMHAVLSGYVARRELPGLVALVGRGDEVHVDVVGAQAQDGAAGMRRDTIFRISSMTKPLTAAAALILIEECKLRLDDAVDRWLPELAARRVLRRVDGPIDETEPAKRPISVRDLLTFRLGYGMLMGGPSTYPILRAAEGLGFVQGPPAPASMPGPDEVMRRFGELPLMYQPGERWLYNTGSDLLGVLIARASGKSLESFLRERIFEPLGMKDTGFSVPESKLERFATSYLVNAGTGTLSLFDAAVGGQWSKPPAFESGAGGLVSTLDDYHAFARMLLQKGRFGKQRVLSRFAVELMTSDQLTAQQRALSVLFSDDPETFGYGFGVSVVLRPALISETVGQFGWDGGLGSVWRSDPREDLTTILMTQQAWTSPRPPAVCLDFWTSAYQALDL